MASKKLKYHARHGSTLKDEEADLVGRWVDESRKSGFEVTPQGMVTSAKKQNHPLHDLFQWDDKKAGHRHRMWQARMFLGSYTEISIETGRPTRGAHNVMIKALHEDKTQRVYRPRREVIKDTDQIEQVSEAYYKRVLSLVEEAENLGLCQADDAWQRLVNAVRRHLPRIIRLKTG